MKEKNKNKIRKLKYNDRTLDQQRKEAEKNRDLQRDKQRQEGNKFKFIYWE